MSKIGTTSVANAGAQRAVRDIVSDVNRAIRRLGTAAGDDKQHQSNFSEAEFAQLDRHARRHADSLSWLAKLGQRARLFPGTPVNDRLLTNVSSRVCAVLRAEESKGHRRSYQEILRLAEGLTVWRPLREMIRVRWAATAKGGLRIIAEAGSRRTAQQLLLRDVLSVMNIDSEFDFTRRGAGGEKALTQAVCDRISAGIADWCTPDIEQYFASLKPTHFDWLPIATRLLENVVFLPKCAKVRVATPKKGDPAWNILVSKYPHLLVSGELSKENLISLTNLTVRQGLPQGSVVSPLLARALLGRELRALLGELDVCALSYMDDLAIGGASDAIVEAAVQTLTARLLANPAGPIRLHDAPIVSADSRKLLILGYFLEPNNNPYVPTGIHVKPGPLRFGRYRTRLAMRLNAAGPDADHYQVAENYGRQWYGGAAAWTKIPKCSWSAFELGTIGYVQDFLLGIPMGGNYPVPGLGIL